MDFNADAHARKVLRELCDTWGQPQKEEYGYWKHITKKLLRNKSMKEVIEMVLNVSEDINDKDFIYEFYPEQEIKKQEKTISPGGVIIKSNPFSQYLYENVKITDIAKKYGLKVKRNKCICPFHDDTDPSMSFNDKLNVFYCFGCHAKGNILTFVNKMEELKKNGKK